MQLLGKPKLNVFGGNMKTMRVITVLVAVILVFSAWMPSPVSARQAEAPQMIAPGNPSQTVDVVAASVVPLTIRNRTGGILFLTLEGPKTYYFSVREVKAKFSILPGRYKVKAVSTGCSGTFAHDKNFKNGGNLVYYCDSQ
jgi:hypothetical protein